jgi:hypothetical protein
MDEDRRRYVLWAWTGILLLAALGFLGWGIALSDAIASDLGSGGPVSEVLNWIGFTVAVGFAGLPWVLDCRTCFE